MKTPLISIIIPTRNEARNLEQCIRSIRSQSYKKIEVIVVDGGSTDDTVNIALENGAKLIYEKPAKGPANARNIGARSAHGEIVFFVDADIVLKRDVIEKCLEIMKKKNLDAVIPLTWIYPTNKVFPNLYFAERLSSRMDLSPNFFRRDVFMKVKFDSSLGVGEDVDMRERLDKINAKIGFAKKAITFHKEPDLRKMISEARWWGRTYLSLLRKGYLKVVLSTIWIFAVAAIIPLYILAKYFASASLALFPILAVYLPYSVYKILKAIRTDADPTYALMIPIFKLFKYSIYAFYILKGIFFRQAFRGR